MIADDFGKKNDGSDPEDPDGLDPTKTKVCHPLIGGRSSLQANPRTPVQVKRYEYDIVRETSLSAMRGQTKHACNNGWIPVGSPFRDNGALNGALNARFWCQAIYREKA